MLLRFAVRFHRLFHRGTFQEASCWVCAALWKRLEQDERFNREMAKAVEDIAAGRFVKWSEIRRDC